MQGQRRAIVSFLTSKKAPSLPRKDAPSEPADGEGSVTSAVGAGVVVLVPKGGKTSEGVRLVWKKGDASPRRALKAGDWQIRHYEIERNDDLGITWRIWGTGEGREIAVRAGEETGIALDPDLSFDSATKRKGARVMAGGAFKGDGGLGLTLIKATRRVDIGWSLLAGERAIASGTCSYG